MNTTSVFIEILITGMQASIWIGLLVYAYGDLKWFTLIMPEFEKLQTFFVLVLFALWYSFGIAIDRFAHALLRLLNPARWLMKLKWTQKGIKYSEKGADASTAILIHEGKATEYLTYYWSRARLLRSTILNLILTVIALLLLISSRCGQQGCNLVQESLISTAIWLGILLVIILYIALVLLEIAYEIRLNLMRREIIRLEKITSKTGKPQTKQN
jgi:hypothetical protein